MATSAQHSHVPGAGALAHSHGQFRSKAFLKLKAVGNPVGDADELRETEQLAGRNIPKRYLH